MPANPAQPRRLAPSSGTQVPGVVEASGIAPITFESIREHPRVRIYVRKADDSELYNRVIVSNESTGSTATGFFYGEVAVTDPNSPVHADHIGDRLMPTIKVSSLTSDAFASGWMQLRGARRRRGVDRGFVLSDHADWPGLMTAIRATEAQRVIVTHGSIPVMVRWLCQQGLEAAGFDTEYGDEDDEQVGAAPEPEASDA